MKWMDSICIKGSNKCKRQHDLNAHDYFIAEEDHPAWIQNLTRIMENFPRRNEHNDERADEIRKRGGANREHMVNLIHDVTDEEHYDNAEDASRFELMSETGICQMEEAEYGIEEEMDRLVLCSDKEVSDDGDFTIEGDHTAEIWYGNTESDGSARRYEYLQCS